MAAGLQVFNEKGKTILDAASIGSMILGSFNTGTSNGSYTDPNIQNRKVWICIAVPLDETIYGSAIPLVFKQEGNTISWEFYMLEGSAATSKLDRQFFYGV